MKHFKYLVTSGCSFSDVATRDTWPAYLDTAYGIEYIHTGLASQGNSLIARKTIFAVQKLLNQGVNPAEILVGIMWSNPDRHDAYFSNLNDQLPAHVKYLDAMRVNPTAYVDNDPGGWLIMNPHWKQKTSNIYYSYLHDFVNHRINTYEKILWVQYYLTAAGIKYFMVPFTDKVFKNEEFQNNPNVQWMKTLVDWTQWLPVDSMHEWCYTHWTAKDFPTIDIQNSTTGKLVKQIDNHPTDFMHKRFTKEIILPHIKNSFPDYFCPEFEDTVQ